MIWAAVVALFAGVLLGWYLTRKQCANSGCTAERDPRCAGGNCTFHCNSRIGCNERCLDVWKKRQMEDDTIRRVIAEEMGH